MNIYTNTYSCFWALLENMNCRQEYLSCRLHAVLTFLSTDSYFKDNYSQSVAYGIFHKNFEKVNEWFCSEISYIYNQGQEQPLSTATNTSSLHNKLLQVKLILFDGYLYTFTIVEFDTADRFIVLTGFQKFTENLYKTNTGFDYTSYINTNMKPLFIGSPNSTIYHCTEKTKSNAFKLEQYTYINTYNSAIDYHKKNHLQLDRGILKCMMQQITPYINETFLKTEKIMRVNGFLVTCPSNNVILIVDYNSNSERKNQKSA